MNNEERRAINPFHLGAGFMKYAIRRGWITLEMDEEDGKLHYFVTEEGKEALAREYGIAFDSPCAWEPKGLMDTI